MFYINTRKSTAPFKQKDLLDAMLIPPEERLTKDHQIVYRFFIANEMLKQIERAKSLNARIKCIAAMVLIGQQDFSPQQQILMHVFEDGRAIVLPKPSKQSAQMFNEKLLRRKMDILATFAMMQPLHYDELLYLAYNMEEITCKYKEYLYREGQSPQAFFLVVDGEFHYVKDCSEREPKMKLQKKGNRKVKKVRRDEQEDQNPNKFVKPHINRYRIGIVEGRLGQAVGLEEIILEEYRDTRRFSVVCNSTENKCVKIPKEYLQTLLQELPHYSQKLYNQMLEADRAKTDLFQRIKQTKSTLKQYLGKSIEKLEKAEQRYMQAEMRSLEHEKEGNKSQLKLPTLHLKSAMSHDYGSRERPRAFSSALAGSLKSEEHQMKSLKSQSNIEADSAEDDYEQGNGSFALTGLRVQSNKKPVKSPFYDEISPSSYQTAQIREQSAGRSFDGGINLPLIPLVGKKSVADIDGSSITLKQLIRVRQKGRSAQYGGMIDCSKLIEEKEEILQRRNNRVAREEIFPVGHIDQRQAKKGSVDDPMKLKASPAHSNRFMEMMLLKVLKRAGYDEAARGASIKQPIRKEFAINELPRPKDAVAHTTVTLKPAAEINRSLSKHRPREVNKKRAVEKQLLLVDSPFDDCYFSKM